MVAITKTLFTVLAVAGLVTAAAVPEDSAALEARQNRDGTTKDRPLGEGAGTLNDMFTVSADGKALVGPGGWMDKAGAFHGGQYNPAAKRSVEIEERGEVEERGPWGGWGRGYGYPIRGWGGYFLPGWYSRGGFLVRNDGGAYWDSWGYHPYPFNTGYFGWW